MCYGFSFWFPTTRPRGRLGVIKGAGSPRNTNRRIGYANLFVGVCVLVSAPHFGNLFPRRLDLKPFFRQKT